MAWAGTPQTITFPALTDRITTDAAFTLGATASSGLPVTYSITSPAGVATVSGGTVTLSGTAGSVTVKASQAGNSTYDPAPSAYRSFIVGTASQKFSKLATCGHGMHEAAIKPDGTLWIWGENLYGQFGDGAPESWRPVPGKVGSATTWTSVACGAYHTAALRADGSLWTAGRNANGQLGSGSTTDRNTLTKVGTQTWLAVACGENHTVALRSDGTLWSCGDNQFGQLGINSTTQSTSLAQIGSVTTWTAVACGYTHTLALRADGTLWAWGLNGHGQIGDGTFIQRNSPVKIGSATTWSAISAGSTHSLALRSDGSLWGWGNNGDGQLGNNAATFSNTPVQASGPATWAYISAGDFHSTGRQQDGTLWVWGNNYRGQFGTTSPVSSSAPQQAAGGGAILGRRLSTTVLQPNGTLQGLGQHQGLVSNTFATGITQIGGPGYPTAWKQLSAAQQYHVAVAQDGTLWTWGLGFAGQLGRGTVTADSTPGQVNATTGWTQTSANESHAAAVRNDGTLWTWGSNGSGRLGDGTTTSRDVPTQVPGTTWTQVACGQQHTAARRADGTLWAWGENASGQVGDNTLTDRTSPVQVGTDTNWAQVACADDFTVAVRTDGTLWAWGSNVGGRLGDGTTTARRTPVQIGTGMNWDRIACGSSHTLALRKDGTLWAWGSNSEGQLGDGSNTARNSPVQIGSDTNWAFIACGKNHSCATRLNGTLWAWGSNINAQLGDGTYTTRLSPVQAGIATNWSLAVGGQADGIGLRTDGTLWMWGNSYTGTYLQLNTFEPNSVWPPRSTQTLSFPALSSQLVEGQSVPLAATASSGLPVTYTVVGPAILSGTTLTATGAGTVTIAAYQNGSPAWYFTESRMQTISVLSAQQSWRQTHFGTTANSGTAADTFDADNDGLTNLVEYAFALSPVSGSANQLPQPQYNTQAQTFSVQFTQPPGVTGVTYSASCSLTLLPGSWFSLTDTGTGGDHVFSLPVGGASKMFIRLEVTGL